MSRFKLLMGALAVLGGAVAIYFVLSSEHALVTHPKGIIARHELRVIVTTIILMLIVVAPTLVLLLRTAWKYRSGNPHAPFEPEKRGSVFKELLLWMIPSLVVVALVTFTWKVTHELDPYRPIESEVEQLTIQVVALDWKWLFIYPEQGIATVNFVQFPAQTPVRFELVADSSPMNSFWIPQLSGQIYAMTGMVTPLHIMADEVGTFSGRAAEINGEGYASMTFVVQASSQKEFEEWVSLIKKSPLQLTDENYEALHKRSLNHPVTFYSHVETGLFKKIITKYMYP